VPLTGPRHVVPEYGIRSVLALSSIVPVPLSEIGHVGNPGRLALPVTVIGTVVLLTNCPDAVPVIVTPPAHTAENVPVTDVVVWLLTLH
jgi:hypothetical protein